MKLSQLNDVQKGHLAWRLDNKTSCGLLTAIAISKGNLGDIELAEIFEKYGGNSPHSAKIHARKVINFKL